MPDSFVVGEAFDGETGLKTGAQLEDLVAEALFAVGSPALDQVTLEDDGAGAARIKDGGVDTDQLADEAVTYDKADDTLKTLVADNVAVFRAHRSAAQTVPNATQTLILYDTEDFDEGGLYDHATGYFHPTVAGYYLLLGTVTWPSMPSGGSSGIRIRRSANAGVDWSNESLGNESAAAAAGTSTMQVASVVYTDGTDEFAIWAAQTTGGSLDTSSAPAAMRFEGFLIARETA